MTTRATAGDGDRDGDLPAAGGSDRGAPPAPPLDDWLASFGVRSVHRRASSADADTLWAAAHAVALRDCLLLGRLVRARIAGVTPHTTFAEMFSRAPFCVLDEGQRHGLYGLCGRIWTAHRSYGTLSGPADFRAWSVPGTVRVVFAQWAAPSPGRSSAGGSILTSEVRVGAVDARARLRLGAMDPFIRAFSGLVGVEALGSAVRRAER